MFDFAQARRTMVDCQIRTFDVTDRAVLAAMGEIPRERFVPLDRKALAYGDGTVEVGANDEGGAWVLLAPMVLARLIQALSIEAGHRVLDVGGGAGYSAAILCRLGGHVVSLGDGRSSPSPVAPSPGGGSLVARSGALDEGCPDDAPFDAILINGAVEMRPDALLAQLADGGRLACLKPEGKAGRAILYVRSGSAISHRLLFDASAPVLAPFRDVPGFSF